MACCPKARRKAIMRAAPLPGSEGFALIEYLGEYATLIMVSRTTQAEYVFSPGTQRFVDVYDVPMFTLWRENGKDRQVFFEIEQ